MNTHHNNSTSSTPSNNGGRDPSNDRDAGRHISSWRSNDKDSKSVDSISGGRHGKDVKEYTHLVVGPGQGSDYYTNDMPLSGSYRNMSSNDNHRNSMLSSGSHRNNMLPSSNHRNNDSLSSDRRTQILSNCDHNSNNVSYGSKASDSLKQSLKDMQKVKKMIDKKLEKSTAKPIKVCGLY